MLRATMRAIVVDRFGPPEVMALREVAEPEPGPGQVRVRLEAVGVNFADTERRRGVYDRRPLPWIPGSEGAGVVESVGPGTDPAWGGSRVAFWAPASAAYAAAAVVPATALFRLAGDLPFELGAALPLQGLTAYGLAHFAASVGSGQTVLVHAAAGGVGSLLVQIARLRGARVLGTVSTAGKAARVQLLGGEPFVYGPALAEEVRAATGGRGVDLVYDSIGQATQEASLSVLAPYGRLISFGEASGSPPPVEMGRLYGRSLGVAAFGLDPEVQPERWAQARETLLEWAGSGALRLLYEVLPLADAAEAHRRLEARQSSGKLLLRP
ncbi:MAG TPA: zinc-binding dehydrogenase [Thermoanaerobaculia bacterium]|nr:zinc-binding dehydrogenase [Thermoanaerobaculia bacterium]